MEILHFFGYYIYSCLVPLSHCAFVTCFQLVPCMHVSTAIPIVRTIRTRAHKSGGGWIVHSPCPWSGRSLNRDSAQHVSRRVAAVRARETGICPSRSSSPMADEATERGANEVMNDGGRVFLGPSISRCHHRHRWMRAMWACG